MGDEEQKQQTKVIDFFKRAGKEVAFRFRQNLHQAPILKGGG